MSKLVRFVLIAVIVCNGYGSVLCFGSDGHVAIEPAFHDHCDHDHAQDHGPHHHSDSTHSDEAESCPAVSCSPCTDVVVAVDVELARLQTLTQLISVQAGMDLTTDVIAYDCRCRLEADSSAYFKPLETIILLT